MGKQSRKALHVFMHLILFTLDLATVRIWLFSNFHTDASSADAPDANTQVKWTLELFIDVWLLRSKHIFSQVLWFLRSPAPNFDLLCAFHFKWLVEFFFCWCGLLGWVYICLPHIFEMFLHCFGGLTAQRGLKCVGQLKRTEIV